MSDSFQPQVRCASSLLFWMLSRIENLFYGNRQELEIEREKGRKLLEQQKSQLFKEFQVFCIIVLCNRVPVQ